MEKKLTLDELQVKSFQTMEHKEIIGGFAARLETENTVLCCR